MRCFLCVIGLLTVGLMHGADTVPLDDELWNHEQDFTDSLVSTIRISRKEALKTVLNALTAPHIQIKNDLSHEVTVWFERRIQYLVNGECQFDSRAQSTKSWVKPGETLILDTYWPDRWFNMGIEGIYQCCHSSVVVDPVMMLCMRTYIQEECISKYIPINRNEITQSKAIRLAGIAKSGGSNEQQCG